MAPQVTLWKGEPSGRGSLPWEIVEGAGGRVRTTPAVPSTSTVLPVLCFVLSLPRQALRVIAIRQREQRNFSSCIFVSIYIHRDNYVRER